jgi:hypothetical protein
MFCNILTSLSLDALFIIILTKSYQSHVYIFSIFETFEATSISNHNSFRYFVSHVLLDGSNLAHANKDLFKLLISISSNELRISIKLLLTSQNNVSENDAFFW